MSNLNKLRPVYLDYAATTPIDERVLQKMLPYMQQDGFFGNAASSTHVYGWQAKEGVSKARRMVAKRLGAENKEIIFTSGATESNNLAILGVAQGYKLKGKHIITSLTEHKSVLDTCKYLESQGYEISYISPEADGVLDLNKISSAIRSDTILISIMHVNNETGVIQDLIKLGHLAKEHNILLHVDGAQSVGKLNLNLSDLDVDLLSVSGHKIYGPKGIGALYIKNRSTVHLMPQMHGGAHEFGFRSGTLATHQIIGLAYALKYSMLDLEEEHARLSQYEQKLLKALFNLGGVRLNGHLTQRKPGHLNISVEGIEGESLIASLNKIAVSSGSACNSAVSSASHVLKAMQVCPQLANSALRISMGKYTTLEQIEMTIEHLTSVISRLRSISPIISF